MLKDYVIISLLIAAYSSQKCYNQRCEISKGYYSSCDQATHNCTRWNETLYGAIGRCEYLYRFPSEDSYIVCNSTETCSSDRVTGQAVCTVTNDVTEDDEPFISGTVEYVLIGFGAFVFVILVITAAACKMAGKNIQGRFQRLNSLQRPLVENVEVEAITTETGDTAHPTPYPPVQNEYASQYPAQYPNQYPAAQYPSQYPAQYPGAQYPVAQYPVAQYPGNTNPSVHPGVQYPQNTQIVHPCVQDPLVVASPAKNSPAKNSPAKNSSAKNSPAKNSPAKTKSSAQHGGFAPPPTGILTPGAVVRLTSKAHGKNLRINQNGDVDGRGGTGQWATFMVHARGPYIALSLQNHPNKFLAIRNNTLTHGTGGKFCSLIVKPNPDGTVSLESAEHRTQHVGILDNGDPKGPHHTGTGKHGQFYVN